MTTTKQKRGRPLLNQIRILTTAETRLLSRFGVKRTFWISNENEKMVFYHRTAHFTKKIEFEPVMEIEILHILTRFWNNIE